MRTNSTLALKPRLKDFLTSYLSKFEVYIWSIARHYNIDKYLDKVKEKTYISLDPSRIRGQESFQKNDHFSPNHLKKPNFHKNLNVFFLKFPNTHTRNTLLVDDTPYRSIFNDCVVLFLKSFEGAHSDGDYLLSTILPYLVSLHSFGFNVQTYMKHNPFGIIISISQNDPYYNMLFEYYNDSCDPIYCTNAKLNIYILLLFLAYQFKFLFIKIICLN